MSPREIISMKCQILFSRKNKKNIVSLSSAESAYSVVSVNAFSMLTAGKSLFHICILKPNTCYSFGVCCTACLENIFQMYTKQNKKVYTEVMVVVLAIKCFDAVNASEFKMQNFSFFYEMSLCTRCAKYLRQLCIKTAGVKNEVKIKTIRVYVCQKLENLQYLLNDPCIYHLLYLFISLWANSTDNNLMILVCFLFLAEDRHFMPTVS